MTLTESLFSNLNVNIKFCHNITHNEKWVEKKTKTDYTLWHVHQGQLWIEINNTKKHVSSGDAVLFFPGDTYRAYSDGNECSFIVTFFSLETGSNFNLLENTLLAGIYHSKEVSSLVYSFRDDFFKYFCDLVQPTLLQYGSFISFLAKLISFHQPIAFHETVAPTPKMPIHDIIDFMNEHFLEPLSVAKLAAKMNVSEKFFIQYFHSQTGMPPKQYLIRRRMHYSLELLANSGNTISHIASVLGYADSYTFSKAFKKFYGESPSFFRESSPIHSRRI